MTGGSVYANAESTARGVYVYGSNADNATASLTDATIETVASGATSAAVYGYAYADITVNSGTYTATGASSAYAVAARNQATVSATVKGGKFSGTTQDFYKGTNATATVSGGYYVQNKGLAAAVLAANHHVLPASLTEGGITYNHKVAEAYTLTWNLDGGTVTVAGTQAPVDATDTPSGYVEKGASLTAPTVTKTGYTFAGWSPSAPAATMPSANTTYTATWTINSYDVTFDKEGGSGGDNNATATYAAAMPTVTPPTKTNYVFAGYWDGDNGTGTQYYNADGTSARTWDKVSNTTLYAKWTAAVASVTVSGATTYYATLGAAWTAANSATATSTIKLLQDVTVSEQLVYNNSNNQNCTLDLNGHTITSSTNMQSPLYINNASTTFTITDGTVGKSGKLSITTTYSSGEISAVNLNAGTLLLEGGTIEVTTGGNHTNGVYVNSGTTFTMNDGIIHVTTTNSKRGRGVYTKGTTTINGGVINMETANNGTVVYYSAGTATINDGKFQITNNAGKYVVYPNSAGSNVKIKGGYYNAAGTYLTNYVSAPYHVFNVSPALDGIYTYEVAEGYTLTWTTDGDALTGTYTSGITKVGATITAPNTPTKTGYTFSGWSPAVAATMPSANTTYTATWTVNSYTIRFLNHDGSVLQSGSVNYGETPVYNGTTPQKATDAEYAYTFDTWAPAVSAVTGDATYTATYTTTPVVASVTANSSGYTLYYTDFSKAFKAVKEEATVAVTITLLKDVSSPALVYSGINTDCTLDLNGHTLTSASPIVAVNIYQAGTTFTITDKTESKSGQIRIVSTQADEAYGLYVHSGHLKLEAGTIYASLAANTCAGVRAVTANSSFTMDGGTIHVVTTNAKDGIGIMASNGTTVINGGTIQVEAAADGYGINRTGGTVTVNGGKFNISASGSAYATNLANNTYVKIYGGYYNINTNLQANCATNYYCVPTTAADKAEVGSDYEYKVVADANTGFHADIVDVDNSAKTLTLNVSMWGSSGWPYTINGVEYQKTAREDDRTLILPYTGNAGDMFGIKVTAKNGTVVSDRLYTIPTEIKTDANLGDQQVLYVKRGATLTVAANKTVKNIYVAPGAKLVINSGKTLTADTVFLRTEAWESAEMEDNGTLTGQICYTRIVKDESRYFQFGLPYDCPVSSVRLSSGHTIAYQGGWLLRSYSESSRATNGANGNNWQTLTDGTIQGCTGYEMFSAFGYYREFYFPVTPTDNTSVSVTRTGDNKAHSGWNIIVSPLMRAYTCKAVPESPVASWLTEDGSYWQRPIEEIKPAIPFSYQAKENGTFSFGATMVAPAPRRVAATDEPTRIQWIQLDVTDAEGNGDQAGIYSHPTRYDETYQTGIDVAKQSFEASRALLYTVHAYGDMAFAGVADSVLERGVPVTVYSPAGQELTFSLRENDWLDRLAEVWLIDNETGTRTDLLRDDYSFLSKAGTTAGRFVIMGRFFAPGVATGIMDAQGGDAQGAKAQKVLVDDKMYILINGRTYDATGKLVTNDNNK